MNHQRPTQTDFDRLLRTKRGEVEDLARHLVAGTLSAEEWAQHMRRVLIDGHARAGYLGRQRAGDMAPYDPDDTEFGRMIMADEQPFLDAFRAAILSGKYDGGDGRVLYLPVLRRAEMYVQRLLGTANEAFLGTSGSALLWWRLGDAEEHCPDCPRLAAGSPYTAQTLTTYPRGGTTACLVFCRCWLERGDGIAGFRPGLQK